MKLELLQKYHSTGLLNQVPKELQLFYATNYDLVFNYVNIKTDLQTEDKNYILLLIKCLMKINPTVNPIEFTNEFLSFYSHYKVNHQFNKITMLQIVSEFILKYNKNLSYKLN